MLRIALPGGKSLEEKTCALFADARIAMRRKESSHAVEFTNYPALSTGHFVKPRRVPILVAEGDFDIGITGKDAVLESGTKVEICAELPYSRSTSGNTRGVLFASVGDNVCSAGEVPEHSVILSEYPNLTRQFFGRMKCMNIVESPGSSEAEVPLKYRFGVALTETGRSLRENGLKIIGTVFESCTVLVANKEALADPRKAEAIHILKLLLRGALEARECFLLSMNVPSKARKKALEVLPSLHSPTISSLAGDEFYSISSVVPKEQVNELIPALLRLGAEGILILPISAVVQSW